jgi:hypothetical protein
VHAKGDTRIAMDLLQEKQRFMTEDSTINDNLMTRKLAASHIDITTPKGDVKPSQIFAKPPIKGGNALKETMNLAMEK